MAENNFSNSSNYAKTLLTCQSLTFPDGFLMGSHGKWFQSKLQSKPEFENVEMTLHYHILCPRKMKISSSSLPYELYFLTNRQK